MHQSLVDCDPYFLSDDELVSRSAILIEQTDHSRNYPSSAIRQGIEGRVRYRLQISGGGEVAHCEYWSLLAPRYWTERPVATPSVILVSPLQKLGESVESVFEDTMTSRLLATNWLGLA